MNTELPRRRGEARGRGHRLRRRRAARRRLRPREGGDRARRPAVRRQGRSCGASRASRAAASGRRASSTRSRRRALTVDLPGDRRRHQRGPRGRYLDLHRHGVGESRPEGRLHRPRQPDIDQSQPTSRPPASAPTTLYAAGFDLSPATVQGVQDGYVDLVIDQQQWLQGFEAIAAALPDAQLRVQRAVHQHRRRLRRREQHRADRAARGAADPLMPGGDATPPRMPASGARRSRARPTRHALTPGELAQQPADIGARVAQSHPSRSAGCASSRTSSFQLGRGRGASACRRQRRWQVHADQDHHRRPPAGQRADPVRRRSRSRPRLWRRPARWASRPSTRSARSPSSCRCGATSSWAGRSAGRSGSSTSRRDAARSRPS